MAKFVFSFRGLPDSTPSAEDEAAWGKWFDKIGPSIADFGNRVGETRRVGACSSQDVLAGYIVVNSDNLSEAAALAEGCPGLRQGGGVEIGQVVAP